MREKDFDDYYSKDSFIETAKVYSGNFMKMGLCFRPIFLFFSNSYISP